MTTQDIYQMVTDRIVSMLEQGVVPWQRPWSQSSDNMAINHVTRKVYSPLNQMLLCEGGEYLTFNQCKALGGSIKKGAKARMIVFYTTSTMTKKKVVDEQTGEEVEVSCIKLYETPVLKMYRVFHLSDCEGIESKLTDVDKCEQYETSPIEQAEQVIKGYLDREHGLLFHNDESSNRAYYSPVHDEVRVPMITQFQQAEEYYSTAFHELTHSTGIEKRCNRNEEMKGVTYFGSENYSREELVAEIGSAMLCSLTGISTEKAFSNSVAYIDHWIQHLKNHKTEFVWAARRAEVAVDYIMNLNDNKNDGKD